MFYMVPIFCGLHSYFKTNHMDYIFENFSLDVLSIISDFISESLICCITFLYISHVRLMFDDDNLV